MFSFFLLFFLLTVSFLFQLFMCYNSVAFFNEIVLHILSAADIQERLNNITRQADVIVSVARQTNTTVSDILLSIDNDLIPKLNELRIFDIGAITAYLESDSKA